MSSAICFSLDQSKILSSGDGLKKSLHSNNKEYRSDILRAVLCLKTFFLETVRKRKMFFKSLPYNPDF